jgi:hypothetical protein
MIALRYVVLVAGALLAACGGDNELTLKLEDVQVFKAQQSRPGELLLSGLAFHSALAVERIDIVRQEDAIQVNVMLVPAKAGMSGSFTYALPLDDKVDRVTFGDAETLVWRRDGGVVRRP